MYVKICVSAQTRNMENSRALFKIESEEIVPIFNLF